MRDRATSPLHAAPPLRAIASLAVDPEVAEDLPVVAAKPASARPETHASYGEALPPASERPDPGPRIGATSEVAPLTTARDAMTLRGGYWELRYQQRSGVVPDCRGLRYIAVLVRDASGGKDPIHAKELPALANGEPAGSIELESEDVVLDSKAKKQLMKRLEEIAFERERAVAVEDFTRATRLDDEYEQIATELGHAGASRGSSRRKTSFVHAGEKARKAVAKAIVEAIDKVAAHPDLAALAEHLTSTIRKGRWLSYTGSVDWHIDFRAPLPRK